MKFKYPMKIIMFANRPPHYFISDNNNKTIKALSSDRWMVFEIQHDIMDESGKYYMNCK